MDKVIDDGKIARYRWSDFEISKVLKVKFVIYGDSYLRFKLSKLKKK